MFRVCREGKSRHRFHDMSDTCNVSNRCSLLLWRPVGVKLGCLPTGREPKKGLLLFDYACHSCSETMLIFSV